MFLYVTICYHYIKNKVRNSLKQEQLKKIYELQKSPLVKFENGEYFLNSKYKYGVISIQKNYAILEEPGNRSSKIHIEFSDLDGSHEGDEVIVKVIFHPKGRVKGRVVKVLSKQFKPVLCYYFKNNFYSFKESIPLSISIKSHDLQYYDVCIIDHEKIIEKLGNIQDPKIDEKISLYLYEERYRLNNFDHITQKEDQLIPSKRVDLTHLNFCTIDPVGAKDFDDAIYWDSQKKTLYVAIADVSAYIQEGSALDLEAKKELFLFISQIKFYLCFLFI